MKELTQKLLKSQLHYNPKTGIFVWKVKPCRRVIVGSVAGSLNKSTGCVVIRVNKKRYKAHRLAWLYVYGEWPKNQIDHKDQTGHHNWIDNLRDVTNQENHKNIGWRSDNTSGVMGVSWNNTVKKWYARIWVDKKPKSLGYFVDINDAKTARKAAEIKYGYHVNHGANPLNKSNCATE